MLSGASVSRGGPALYTLLATPHICWVVRSLCLSFLREVRLSVITNRSPQWASSNASTPVVGASTPVVGASTLPRLWGFSGSLPVSWVRGGGVSPKGPRNSSCENRTEVPVLGGKQHRLGVGCVSSPASSLSAVGLSKPCPPIPGLPGLPDMSACPHALPWASPQPRPGWPAGATVQTVAQISSRSPSTDWESGGLGFHSHTTLRTCGQILGRAPPQWPPHPQQRGAPRSIWNQDPRT
jgi:hypothetical protein